MGGVSLIILTHDVFSSSCLDQIQKALEANMNHIYMVSASSQKAIKAFQSAIPNIQIYNSKDPLSLKDIWEGNWGFHSILVISEQTAHMINVAPLTHHEIMSLIRYKSLAA